jgi:hypothetical protein
LCIKHEEKSDTPAFKPERFADQEWTKRGLGFYRLLKNAMQIEPLTYKKPVQSSPPTHSLGQLDSQLTKFFFSLKIMPSGCLFDSLV